MMAVQDFHPTFANPTIQEAICELHFQMSDGQTWRPDYPTAYFRAIEGDFPSFEPVAHAAVQMRIGQGGVEQLLASQLRTRYRHGMRNLLLQFGDGLLAVNELRPYASWDQMKADIMQAWNTLRDTIPIGSVSRIGLRYINRLLRSGPEELPSQWLQPSRFIPAAVLTFPMVFSSRVAAALDDSSRAIVQVSSIDDDPLVFMFDIDCIMEQDLNMEERRLIAALDNLHGAVWTIFDEARTDHFTAYLQG